MIGILFLYSKYFLVIKEKKEIREVGKIVSIEEVKGDTVFIRGTHEEIEKLERKGFSVFIYPETKPAKQEGYHDYYKLTEYLDTLQVRYPDLVYVFSMGKSVEGRELWVVKVSDNPEDDEPEPEVRFVGTIHGDEPVGTELILMFIDSLLSWYSKKPEIKELVDEREIFFIPLFNPDGNLVLSRYNANGVDLNRNFPVPDGSPGGDGTYELEPETESLINFSAERHFVLSCTFHGGALVVNYPWDYSPDSTPDQELVYKIALAYARENPLMYHSTEFDSGVTHGYSWYPVYGSLQDWSYHETGCIDYTVEISEIKYPPYDSIPAIFRENKGGMIEIIKKAGWGVHGSVRDALAGNSLNAIISVYEIGKDMPAPSGEFHRVLLPGEYTLIFSSPGYTPRVYMFFPVKEDTSLHVKLFPQKRVRVCVRTEVDGVNIKTILSDTGEWRVDGEEEIDVLQGFHYFLASKPGYKTVIDTCTVSGGEEIEFRMEPMDTVVFMSSFGFDGREGSDTIEVNDSIPFDELNVYFEERASSPLTAYLFTPWGDSIMLFKRKEGISGWFEREILSHHPGGILKLSGNAGGRWILLVKSKDDTGGDVRWGLEFGRIAGTEFSCSMNSNATTGIVRLHVEWDGRVVIALYDICGRERERIESVEGGDFVFDLSSFPPGIYFVRVNAGIHRMGEKIVLVR
ncbi:hypothetical protein DRQ16_03345 [bacterium]|nr:MAG: hypothetical protein DRQ16_03345 [bacterium]